MFELLYSLELMINIHSVLILMSARKTRVVPYLLIAFQSGLGLVTILCVLNIGVALVANS